MAESWESVFSLLTPFYMMHTPHTSVTYASCSITEGSHMKLCSQAGSLVHPTHLDLQWCADF